MTLLPIIPPTDTQGLRPQVGLMLSIGEPPIEGRNYPKKLDHFRPKPGALEQYTDAADKFTEQFGPTPRTVPIVLVSDEIGDVLDVRFKVWGTSGLKAIGRTNLATLPPDLMRERLYAIDDELITFPDTGTEPGAYKLQGPDDPAVTKLGGKFYGTLRFSIPAVTGLMTLAEISTTAKRSMSNLHSGLLMAKQLTGVLTGIPLELRVRPARLRYLDKKDGTKKNSDFYELILDTKLTFQELCDLAALRRSALTAPARLALPAPTTDPDSVAELAPVLWHTPERDIDDGLGDGFRPPVDDEFEQVLNGTPAPEPEPDAEPEPEEQGSVFEEMAEKAQKRAPKRKPNPETGE